MVRIWKSLLIFAAALGHLAAGGFPPVTPDIWKVGQEATAGTGAIVLECRIVVTPVRIERRYRIRITGDAGRAAIEMPTFNKECYDIEGQTVRPDGTTVPFTRKDFQSKVLAKSGDREVERTVLIPPGVTGDCLVDLSWNESKPFTKIAAAFGSMELLDLSGPHPVRQVQVDISKLLPWAWVVVPGRALKSDKIDKSTWVQISLQDIPALRELPYAIGGARRFSRILLYPVPDNFRYAAGRGPDFYWEEVGSRILGPLFDDEISKGRAYKALSEELLKNRPPAPAACAFELAKRLDGRIRNTGSLTFEESSKRTKKDAEEEIVSTDLGKAAERGFTDKFGMTLLLYQLLKDAGLAPQVALVADRDFKIFDPKLLTWTQFDNILLGVEDPGKGTVWFDPTQRFAIPGLINEDYQGTRGLSFDSRKWKPTAFTVPIQSPNLNRRSSNYALELAEEEDRFTVESQFSGLPEWRERQVYLRLEQKEQDRLLKENLEKGSKQVSVATAEVRNAVDLGHNLTWKAKGRIEREPGRRREVDPFPVETWPVWVPNQLDQSREDLIVLPYALTYAATSSFSIPAGYALGRIEPVSWRNGFGSIDWALQRETRDGKESCTVDLQVEVSRPVHGAQDYAELRDFLDHVRQACGRTLVLERAR